MQLDLSPSRSAIILLLTWFISSIGFTVYAFGGSDIYLILGIIFLLIGAITFIVFLIRTLGYFTKPEPAEGMTINKQNGK